MKKLILITVAILCTSTVFSQGIQFEHGTLAEAFEKAKKENKWVFVDTYTEWCGPCKALSKRVFPQKKVGDYFNLHFVNIKLDAEKGEGIEFAKKYNINAYPTLLFLKPNGDVMYTTKGAVSADVLIGDAKIAMNPSLQLTALEKRYANGERNLDFLLQYCAELRKAEKTDRILKLGDAYLETIEMKDLLNPKVLRMVIGSHKLTFKGEVYQFMYANWEKFEAMEGIGKDGMMYYMERPAREYLGEVAKKGSIEELNKGFEEVKRAYNTNNDTRDIYYSLHHLEQGRMNKWYDIHMKRMNASISELDYENAGNVLSFMIYQTKNKTDLKGSKHFKRLLKTSEKFVKEYEDKQIRGAYKALINLYKMEGNKQKALESVDTYLKQVEMKFGKVFTSDLKLREEIENM